MRRVLVVVTLILLFGLAAPIPPAGAQDPGSQVIALVNGLRASYGLPGLTPHPSLNAAAQMQANWIISSGNWGHTGEGGSSPQDRATAAGYQGFVLENYVGGGGMSPQGAVDWWIGSPIHLRGMLATPHEHVGVGVASGERAVVYVLLVGRPVTARPAASSGSGGNSGAAAEEEEDVGPVAVPVVRAEPREDGSVVHVVQQGQTVWDLAMVYGVDLGELRALNNLGPSMVVRPGDEILVQLGPGMAPPPTPTPPMNHIVQEGQTLWDIAAMYNLNLDELMLINGIQRGQVVHPGDELMLHLPPGMAPPPTPTPPLTHRVREGETAWTIAALYGLTLDELLELNGMQRPAVVYPGDEILIRQPDPTATPTEIPTEGLTPTPTGTPEPAEPALTPEAPGEAVATEPVEPEATPSFQSGPIIVPSPETPPVDEATPSPAEGEITPAPETPADALPTDETAEAAPLSDQPPAEDFAEAPTSDVTPVETPADVPTDVTPSLAPLEAATATPDAPLSAETGTPVALAQPQALSPTPIPPTPTVMLTHIPVRSAAVTGNTNTQPYLIGGIMVLVGMVALGWIGLMALLRRQQM